MLEEVKVKIEVEEVPRGIITMVIDLKTTTGEETRVLLEANKEIEITNMNPRIGQITPGITKMDKEGDITIGIMIIQGSTVEVGEAIITIIRDSTIITGAEAVAGIHNKVMISKVNHIDHM